jgi:purine-binding chemotaxis protein CheW
MTNDASGAESFVLFELAGTTYGIRSAEVRQLEMIENITPVPNAADTVEGVVFSRGQVIPAISLRTRFGFEKIPYDLRSRLLVVSVDNRNIGLIVDSAREFKNISAESISPLPDGLAELSGQYLEAVATIGDGTMVLLLNLAEVIKTESCAGSTVAHS